MIEFCFLSVSLFSASPLTRQSASDRNKLKNPFFSPSPSLSASSLHETLEVDFYTEEAAAKREGLRRGSFRRPVARASRVISWAERRAGSVRKLHLKWGLDVSLKDFSSEGRGQARRRRGAFFIRKLLIGGYLAKLSKEFFWESLRDSIVPAGRLRSFVVKGFLADASESDVEPLGQLAGSLEELELNTL